MFPTLLYYLLILAGLTVWVRLSGVCNRDEDHGRPSKPRRTCGTRHTVRKNGVGDRSRAQRGAVSPFRRTLADRLDAAGVREINPGENEELRSEILDHINKGW